MAISTLNLAELDENQGFVITGVNNGENSGYSVSDAGDINGDGIDDLIIGAPGSGYYGYYGSSSKGYVVFGGSDVADSGSLELSELDGNNGFVINSINSNDRLGSSVSSAGDINGDGIDDLIIGAPSTSIGGNYSNEGESYVIFGSSDGFNASLELVNLDASNGFAITGIDNFDRSGSSVSSAGDINGDGLDDLIISAPSAGEDSNYGNSNGQGESYVVFGSSDGFTDLDLAELDGSNGFTISGIDNYDNSGRSVSSAGDINGDGIDDIVIGAPYAGEYTNYGNSNSQGESYVVFGGSEVGNSGNLDLAELNGSNGFTISGIDSYDSSGRSVSGAGDINGDGIDDIVIGAPFADSNDNNYANQGESYVIFGSSNGFDANLDLASPDNIDGFVIAGVDEGGNFGSSVSNAGDINGDGVDDIVVGAPYGNNNTGESYVVFGVVPLELTGTDNDDVLTGGSGDDLLSGLGGNDILEGLAGADEILGGSGNDLIIGGEGDDTIQGQGGDDNISGNEGNDSLIGNGGRDDIVGGNGDDTIVGGNRSDRLLGEAGNDSIIGGAGGDRILGGDGDDRLFGLVGNDLLFGGNGNDTLEGSVGNDTLEGGAGNDSLIGNANNDVLIGIDSNSPNSRFGAGELDTLIGGVGSNTFVLADADRIFYDDGNNLTAGNEDFALISNFDSDSNTIQLQGTADLYSLDFFTSNSGSIDARLIFDPGISAVGETIAVLENVDPSLSVDDSAFVFL